MNSIVALVVAVVFSGCGRDEASSHTTLLELTVPALEERDRTVIEALDELNQQLSKLYPDHPNLPIIIERGDPWIDMGDEDLIVPSLPEQRLGERLRVFSAGTLHGHMALSHNDFIIFKTWHNGVPAAAPEERPQGFGFDTRQTGANKPE